ncbi:response regulator transcription factor [Emticicia fluvialis]|uniref:response regulator transcription factor n=1 Tax=Emticicia fluvialis TaxID=2974474 RepID=UPI0021656E04|nr:response regulator [Emticicia fluvialis]
MMKIRIAIADDHRLLAQSLENTLNTHEEFEVVSVCHTCKDTLWNIEIHHPDVLLLDLNMPIVGSVCYSPMVVPRSGKVKLRINNLLL